MKLRKISIFAIISVLLALSALLVACNPNTSTNEETDPADSTPAATISANEIADYKFVVSESVSDVERDAMNTLVRQIYGKYNKMMKVSEDILSETDKEILVGDVNRPQMQNLMKTLKYDDRFVGFFEGKLCIAGGSPAATVKAIEEFCQLVNDKADSETVYNDNNKLEYKHSYAQEDIKINGVSVREYTIMYSYEQANRELTLAKVLQRVLIATCGIELDIVADNEGAYGNVIYLNGAATSSELRVEGDILYVSGANENDVFFATQTLANRIDGSTDGNVTVEAKETLTYQMSDLDLNKWGVSAEKMTFMSYNLQNAGNGSTAPLKYQRLANLVETKSPDFLLVQECLTSGSGAENLLAAMKSRAKYGIVTEMGVHQAVFYDKTKYTLVDKGLKDIGKADDEYGSAYDRNMFWMKFRSNTTGVEFIVLSLHIDYVKAANAAQLKQIIDFMTENVPELPIVMGGDYNLEEKALDIDGLTEAGFVNCCKTASVKVNETEATFPSKNIIIDFIFAKGMQSEYFETLTGEPNPSDHRPVYAELYMISN